MRLSRRIMAVISGIALLPLTIVLLAATLAALLGCEVSELGPARCSVIGLDIGGLLHAALTTGWISLITIPALMAILSVWAFFEVFVWNRKRRRARRAARQGLA